MKRILIISPYFPPSNAADTHRIRMSLPYFKEFGYLVEVVTVNEVHSHLKKDPHLAQTIPSSINIHNVEAFSTRWTSKVGLGSLALRSMAFYRTFVNTLLKETKFDLIYFSTTQFPITILGPYWKKKFNIPYVIDMQDPWHSEYYLSKPKAERPKKFWFSYRLNKLLEPVAMKHVDGIISVNGQYFQQLADRYPNVRKANTRVIPFGYMESDFDVAKRSGTNNIFQKDPSKIRFVYVGVVGNVMRKSLELVFAALAKLKNDKPSIYEKVELHFVGTSYAPPGSGKKTVEPLASSHKVENVIFEQTNRVGFYDALKILSDADGLFILGSDSKEYTASKIYPYVFSKKPTLAIVSPESNAFNILKQVNAGVTLSIDDSKGTIESIQDFISAIANATYKMPERNETELQKYSAKNMARLQCELFDQIIKKEAHVE